MIGLNADIYLTGHGDRMTMADVQNKLDLIQDKYNKIRAMVAEGKSLGEAKQTLGETDSPAGNGPRIPTFTESVYQELTKKR